MVLGRRDSADSRRFHGNPAGARGDARGTSGVRHDSSQTFRHGSWGYRFSKYLGRGDSARATGRQDDDDTFANRSLVQTVSKIIITFNLCMFLYCLPLLIVIIAAFEHQFGYRVPPVACASTSSVLYRYVVDACQAWAFCPLLPLVLLSSYVHTLGSLTSTMQHAGRILVAVVSVIGVYDVDLSISSFISIRTLVLTHCLFTISAEAMCVIGWEHLDAAVHEPDVKTFSLADGSRSESAASLRRRYERIDVYFWPLVVLLAAATILLESVLIMHVIYHDTPYQKMVAVVIATLIWLSNYSVVYGSGKWWSLPAVEEGEFQHLTNVAR